MQNADVCSKHCLPLAISTRHQISTCHSHTRVLLMQISVADGSDKHHLEVTWTNGQHKATLKADVEEMNFDIIATQPNEEDSELHTFR